MGDGTNGVGDCPRITVDGIEWKVGWPTKRAKKRLEQMVAGKAITEVDSLKDMLSAELYRKKSDDVLSLVTAGEHRVGGQLWNRVMASESGATLYLLSLLRENHPDATEEQTYRLMLHSPEQVRVAIALVTPNFYRLIGEEKGLTPDQQAQLMKQAQDALSQPEKTANPAG